MTSQKQKHAIIRLLQDDDPETVHLVKEQLMQNGNEILEELKKLTLQSNVQVSRYATDVLHDILAREAREDFTLLCHFFNYDALENVCWTLCRCMHPEVDTQPYETQMKAWGRQFLFRSSAAISNQERVDKLVEFVHGELGFQGNTEDYYNEKNSLLSYVIDTRRGSPLSLTLVYMFIAECAGMKVCGVNLPGHFIARHGNLFFDPFHGGKVLSKKDCEEILSCQHLTFSERYLHPATARQIFIRILANLLHIYDLTGEREKHAQMNFWIRILIPQFPTLVK